MNNYQTPSRRSGSVRFKKSGPKEWVTILLCYILPFVIFNTLLFVLVTTKPKCELTVADTNDYLSTEVTLKVKSLIPTKSVTLSMNAEPFEPTKNGRQYSVLIQENGTVEANIVSLNGMSTTQFVQVDVLDDTPPSIEEASINDGVVSMTLKDSQSGINFASLSITNGAGETIEPISTNKDTGALSVAIDDSELHVSVEDLAGNTVQGNFASHKEGEEETLETSSSTTSDESVVQVN